MRNTKEINKNNAHVIKMKENGQNVSFYLISLFLHLILNFNICMYRKEKTNTFTIKYFHWHSTNCMKHRNDFSISPRIYLDRSVFKSTGLRVGQIGSDQPYGHFLMIQDQWKRNNRNMRVRGQIKVGVLATKRADSMEMV